jgi:uncharacterized membrane protein YkoI
MTHDTLKGHKMMLKSKLAAFSLAAFGLAPMMVAAETPDAGEVALFQSAKIDIQAAGKVALDSHAGKLAGVQFGDEDGTGVFDALVVDADGTPWLVRVDAMTGNVLAEGKAAVMGDDLEDHDSAEAGDDESEIEDNDEG